MDTMIQYVGIDVDDKNFHGFSISSSGEERAFACKPSVGSLMRQLEKIRSEGHTIKLCYEATYIGFSLYRSLTSQGYDCAVIAPSLIPQKKSDRVKTDRIDARRLATYYKKDELTVVHVPAQEEEKIRDLLRSRKFIRDQQRSLKTHILSLCRRYDLNYRVSIDKPKASYWTCLHMRWLEKNINSSSGALCTNLSLLLQQLKLFEQQISLYEEEIKKYAKSEEYNKKVVALNCYRGIDVLSAMTLITEIGDVNRFPHPRGLTAYVGMELIEESSGGKEKRYCISRMGNKNIRTTVVEAAQMALKPPQISKALKNRRSNTGLELVSIADRCMYRLYKKSQRMYHVSKPLNKIKVACAREMLGFIWESLKQVS
jgi:transposase